MLRAFELDCSCQGQPVRRDWAVYLHGFLMEHLTEAVTNIAHDDEPRQFSQYLLPAIDGFCWRISCWDDALSDALSALLKEGAALEIKQKGVLAHIDARRETAATERELFSRFFLSEAVQRRFELKFLTPSTHRQNDAYVLFPTADLIVNSLYRRFCTFTEFLSLEDENARKEAAACVRIVRYSLRSAPYYIEGNRIPGYTGSLTLWVDGNPQLARLAGMVLAFAPYAGLGIKTALGMGGCELGANLPPTVRKEGVET